MLTGNVSNMGSRERLEARITLFALLQKYKDQQKDLYLCLVDYTIAFDDVKHSKLLSVLERRDSQHLK